MYLVFDGRSIIISSLKGYSLVWVPMQLFDVHNILSLPLCFEFVL